MKKDKREINEVWEHENPLGEKYLYGRVGSGKNTYIKSLKYLGKTDLRRKILEKLRLDTEKWFKEMDKKIYGTKIK